MASYAIEEGITDENLGFYVLTILNAGSVFGRIVPNFFADTTGPLNVTAPFVLFCAIISFCWTSIHSLPQLVLFCAFYGFFSGTFVSMTGPSIASLSPAMNLVGTHMGMSFSLASLGLLIGNPVAGVLLGKGWIAPAMFCGTCNVLAAACIFTARINKVGWKLLVKA